MQSIFEQGLAHYHCSQGSNADWICLLIGLHKKKNKWRHLWHFHQSWIFSVNIDSAKYWTGWKCVKILKHSEINQFLFMIYPIFKKKTYFKKLWSMIFFPPSLFVNNFTTAAHISTNPWIFFETVDVTLWMHVTILTWALFWSSTQILSYLTHFFFHLLSYSLWQIHQFQSKQPHQNSVALACGHLHPLASWSLQHHEAFWSGHVCPTGGLRGVHILGPGLQRSSA